MVPDERFGHGIGPRLFLEFLRLCCVGLPKPGFATSLVGMFRNMPFFPGLCGEIFTHIPVDRCPPSMI